MEWHLQALELNNEVKAMKYRLRKGVTQSRYYEVRFSYLGKEYTRSTKSTTKTEANKRALEIISKIVAADKYPKSLGSRCLDDAIESRLEDFSKNDKRYIKNIRKLNPSLFKKPMATVSSEDLWKLKLKYKKKRSEVYGKEILGQSVNRAFKVINSTFEKTKAWGWIDFAPHNRELAEIPYKPRKALSDDEIRILFDTCIAIDDVPLWKIIKMYLNTGLRRTELEKLKREHVVYGTQAILLEGKQKNGDFNQEFIINDEAKEIIEEQLRSHNQEQVFSFTNFRRRSEKMFAEADMNSDIHSLRHTAITNVAKCCTNLFELKTFSRHKSISQLERYSHLVEEEHLIRIANHSKIDEKIGKNLGKEI